MSVAVLGMLDHAGITPNAIRDTAIASYRRHVADLVTDRPNTYQLADVTQLATYIRTQLAAEQDTPTTGTDAYQAVLRILGADTTDQGSVA